ncbi:hypothetical protein BT96DRAFT_874785 [Gymnopus androsaceus JB14]|uniref:Uncharacterized protein n=1 Tax=Gymnopus androsaceus JB14 TaxID=1447944 RepID=A0A6A4I5E8_9AGAR|nr:hypothetical protein BT96DRAFT_874785 [Gymnopus androsaceus JB14]
MEASVGEPFVLSSYSTTKKTSKSASIFASHHKAGGISEGYVTVAAQGDGIHVLDLSTLHPVISHTLGPTTAFSCPSVTLSELQGADHICTTYAGISSEDEYDRTVWMWKENLSSSVADRAVQKKKAVTLPHAVSGLYISEELPSRVLITSSQGDVTVLHADLQVQATHSSKSQVLKVFVFSRKNCTFLPPRSTPSTGAIVVLLFSSSGSLRIQVLAVDSEDQFHELGDIELAIKPETFCDISCSTSGCFSILLKNGTWSPFELKATDDSLYLNLLDTIRLSSLSFITSSSAESSVVSLGSSHALLGGLTGPAFNREIVLLLWDLSFSVLLASRTLPLPSNISGDKVSLTLVDALSSSTVLLLLSPASSERRKSQSHSAATNSSGVWAVPINVPPTSSIANAIGRAAAATPWLAVNGDSATTPHDTERTKVLNEMRSAMDRNQPQNANTAFFEWEKRQVKEEDSASPSKDKNQESSPIYGYNFTKEVLNIVLQPSKPSNTPYSSQIVQHLLEKKTVSAGMVEVGLLAVLRLRNDWKSITLALTHVTDLQEVDIVECLCFILARHRRTTSSNAMQVDSSPSMDEPPTLRAFLNLFLRYNFSAIPLRAAFRRYFSDVDDVVCLLEVLDNWIGQWAGRDLRLLPSSKMMKKNEYGILVLKPDSTSSEVPSMLQITTFLQSLLDTSFINLIQTPSAHRILKKIQLQIDPEIKHIEQTEQLRGPLDLFVRAQAKAAKEAKDISEGVKVPVADWRQRKKLLHEQAGMVGLYQLGGANVVRSAVWVHTFIKYIYSRLALLCFVSLAVSVL